MRNWIELNSSGSGRGILLQIGHIVSITSALKDGNAYAVVTLDNGSTILTEENYNTIKDILYENEVVYGRK